MIKKMFSTFLICLIIFLTLINSKSYATYNDDVDIPTLTIEQLTMSMKVKQTKIDIIKKNNIEIEKYKSELATQINDAVKKINALKIEVTEEKVIITEEKLEELKSLLEFLQDSTKTLNEDVTKVSKEIDIILDLIMTKGMLLEQYDQIIENQNTVIVKMKNILATVEKI